MALILGPLALAVGFDLDIVSAVRGAVFLPKPINGSEFISALRIPATLLPHGRQYSPYPIKCQVGLDAVLFMGYNMSMKTKQGYDPRREYAPRRMGGI